MPVNPAANLRSGGNKFLLLAATLCRLTNALAPAIRARYSDRPALLTLLTAAEGVCALLPAAQQEQYTMDAADAPTFDPADGVLLPGQSD
jgi:hypothetical protein